jgi:hypothetical protein
MIEWETLEEELNKINIKDVKIDKKIRTDNRTKEKQVYDEKFNIIFNDGFSDIYALAHRYIHIQDPKLDFSYDFSISYKSIPIGYLDPDPKNLNVFFNTVKKFKTTRLTLKSVLNKKKIEDISTEINNQQTEIKILKLYIKKTQLRIKDRKLYMQLLKGNITKDEWKKKDREIKDKSKEIRIPFGIVKTNIKSYNRYIKNISK